MHRPESVTRPRASLILTLLPCLVLSGCLGFGGGSKSAERTARVLRVVNSSFDYAVLSRAPEGSLGQLGHRISNAIDQEAALRPTLDRVASSPDPYGEAIAAATCIGLDQLATEFNPYGRTPGRQQWEDFLTAQVHKLIPDNPLNVVERKVKKFSNTAELATVNPRLAIFYHQGCGKR